MRLLYAVITTIILASESIINPAWADVSGGYGEHMMWGGGWIMGPVIMFVMLVAVVSVIVLIVRWLAPGVEADRGYRQSRTAIQILEERFAHGEIDKTEFDERKRTLAG